MSQRTWDKRDGHNLRQRSPRHVMPCPRSPSPPTLPPNGLELSCRAAWATVAPFSRILAGVAYHPFRTPAGSVEDPGVLTAPAMRRWCPGLQRVARRSAGRASERRWAAEAGWTSAVLRGNRTAMVLVLGIQRKPRRAARRQPRASRSHMRREKGAMSFSVPERARASHALACFK